MTKAVGFQPLPFPCASHHENQFLIFQFIPPHAQKKLFLARDGRLMFPDILDVSFKRFGRFSPERHDPVFVALPVTHQDGFLPKIHVVNIKVQKLISADARGIKEFQDSFAPFPDHRRRFQAVQYLLYFTSSRNILG